MGLTSRRSQPPLALSVPLSRFTSRVGGGSAFYVRCHSRTMKSFDIRVLAVISAVVVAGFVLLSKPISRAKDTPLMRAYSRLHQTCGKLRYYADEHSTFPGGAPTNGSIDTLVSAGILSADDAAFLRDHQVEYHGFDLGRIAAGVPVFEMVFTNNKTPHRIVSYRDGHTVMSDLETKP